MRGRQIVHLSGRRRARGGLPRGRRGGARRGRGSSPAAPASIVPAPPRISPVLAKAHPWVGGCPCFRKTRASMTSSPLGGGGGWREGMRDGAGSDARAHAVAGTGALASSGCRAAGSRGVLSVCAAPAAWMRSVCCGIGFARSRTPAPGRRPRRRRCGEDPRGRSICAPPASLRRGRGKLPAPLSPLLPPERPTRSLCSRSL